MIVSYLIGSKRPIEIKIKLSINLSMVLKLPTYLFDAYSLQTSIINYVICCLFPISPVCSKHWFWNCTDQTFVLIGVRFSVDIANSTACHNCLWVCGALPIWNNIFSSMKCFILHAYLFMARLFYSQQVPGRVRSAFRSTPETWKIRFLEHAHVDIREQFFSLFASVLNNVSKKLYYAIGIHM